MQEHDLQQVLARIETSETPSVAGTERAKEQMLRAFDSLDSEVGAAADAGSAAEITLLVQPEPDVRRRPRILIIPAAAAAVVALIWIAAQIRPPERFDPSVVVAAETETGAAVEAMDEVGANDQLVQDQDFVDDDLPRLIQGEFTTEALGGQVSFVVAEPLWLTLHQTGLLKLSTDPQNPLAAEMVLARPVEPADDVARDEMLGDYLAAARNLDGQMQPVTIDGVTAAYWRGRPDVESESARDCSIEDLCPVLFGGPNPLGLRLNMTNDVAELPLDDGGSLLLLASIPFDNFGLSPFATPFVDIVQTLSIVEVAADQ